MKIKASLSVLAAVLCACLLLTGCNLFQNSNDDTQQNQAADQQVNTAQVIVESALLFDEPDGGKVGQLAKGTTVTFTETVNTGAEIWVRCDTPIADTWMLLSDLQVTAGNSMSVVYGPDGSVSSGTIQMVVGPNGEMTIVSPDGSNGDIPVIPGTNEQERLLMEGSFFYVPYDEYGFHGSITTWYLGHNGYALMESGDGEVDGSTIYLNYTNQRLFGTYTIINGVFTFTVTEDWYYSHGDSIGAVYTYEFSETDQGFTLDGDEFIPISGGGDYLDEVTGHQGGPTGNDQTGTISDVNIDGLEGWWVFFEPGETQDTVNRHIVYFDGNGHCSYSGWTLKRSGDSWTKYEVIDFEFDGAYYLYQGEFYIAADPYEFGPLVISVSGDTLTLGYEGYQGKMHIGTFTRFDGPGEPLP